MRWVSRGRGKCDRRETGTLPDRSHTRSSLDSVYVSDGTRGCWSTPSRDLRPHRSRRKIGGEIRARKKRRTQPFSKVVLETANALFLLCVILRIIWSKSYGAKVMELKFEYNLPISQRIVIFARVVFGRYLHEGTVLQHLIASSKHKRNDR